MSGRDRSPIEYLKDMHKAASSALTYTSEMDLDRFVNDDVTCSAVAYCHFIVGTAALRMTEKYPDFVTDHPELPWTRLGNFRDRLLENFFELDPMELWTATQVQFPELLSQLDSLRNWRAQGE